MYVCIYWTYTDTYVYYRRCDPDYTSIRDPYKKDPTQKETYGCRIFKLREQSSS